MSSSSHESEVLSWELLPFLLWLLFLLETEGGSSPIMKGCSGGETRRCCCLRDPELGRGPFGNLVVVVVVVVRRGLRSLLLLLGWRAVAVAAAAVVVRLLFRVAVGAVRGFSGARSNSLIWLSAIMRPGKSSSSKTQLSIAITTSG